MDIYNLIQKYSKNKSESIMWESVKMLSECLQHMLSEEDYKCITKKIYYILQGGHFNEEYAKEIVAKMYYINDNKKVYAPYWVDNEVMQLYETVKKNIPQEYNKWDFYVTLNMIKSDNYILLKTWYPEATNDELAKKFVDLTVNWLNDSDNPYGTEKIWKYLN